MGPGVSTLLSTLKNEKVGQADAAGNNTLIQSVLLTLAQLAADTSSSGPGGQGGAGGGSAAAGGGAGGHAAEDIRYRVYAASLPPPKLFALKFLP